MHRFNIRLVVVLSLSCSGVKTPLDGGYWRDCTDCPLQMGPVFLLPCQCALKLSHKIKERKTEDRNCETVLAGYLSRSNRTLPWDWKA